MLRPHPSYKPRGPVLLVVMDGIGRGAGDEADAVAIASTPTLDRLWVPGVRAELRAHGKAVGLPSDDDMGNSEVGHNALGAGKIYAQGALLVGRAIQSGRLFEGAAWKQIVERGLRGGAIHFLGLHSDGNVHSHLDHLEALLDHAAKAGCKKLYVHALLDGRDVPPTSALEYIDRTERYLANLRASGIDARIVSGGGRMQITMDRYEADWAMVERGWHTHVLADARQFPSATAAIETYRAEHPGVIDQDLPAFVVAPPTPIVDGDAVVMYNFRGDRAIEISLAFDAEQSDKFAKFDRLRRPDVVYAGMMEYDGDLHIPKRFLVEPPAIERPMGEILAAAHVPQLAISETQKYGHVTYFWNGNRSGMFDHGTETYVEIPSDQVPFEQRPWMKAAEITDRLIAELRTGKHRFARVNYANGDMVGHTGSFDATIVAVETVDLQLARLAKAIEELQGILVVTADHGNADEMFQRDKHGKVQRDKKTGVPVVKTSHSLSPVPFLIHDPARGDRYEIDPDRAKTAGIANVTATCLELLGYTPPDDLEPSLLRFR
ncbi:MAG TPA: 2,3-bisphosphoglycerate-independent phosphoglycerate mutase [Kofleriaceae bacterium]|nr:2,3-bisphosphoglycerate-independent phosphoglycerate mutase [Kofleriaceae bacterium]